ncbi:MAG: FtsX-like permease family protein, partial [Terracidiphilus sp.]
QAHLSNMGEVTFVLATRQNAMSMAQDARQVFIHANPLLDPMMVTSLPELIRYSAGNYQMMAELVTALGFIGLALTVVGLYGFLAFRVTQRRREIGIRMALGASRESTAILILRDTVRIAAVGLLLGLGLSLVTMRLETSVLFGVRPLDVMSIAAALFILSIAVAAAAPLLLTPCRLCAPNNPFPREGTTYEHNAPERPLCVAPIAQVTGFHAYRDRYARSGHRSQHCRVYALRPSPAAHVAR